MTITSPADPQSPIKTTPVELSDSDVLCGIQGIWKQRHPGNVICHRLINLNRKFYSTTQGDKLEIGRSIVSSINELGGRFLAKQMNGTPEWYEIGKEEAAGKILQAFCSEPRRGEPEQETAEVQANRVCSTKETARRGVEEEAPGNVADWGTTSKQVYMPVAMAMTGPAGGDAESTSTPISHETPRDIFWDPSQTTQDHKKEYPLLSEVDLPLVMATCWVSDAENDGEGASTAQTASESDISVVPPHRSVPHEIFVVREEDDPRKCFRHARLASSSGVFRIGI